jgi:hypothetical protein
MALIIITFDALLGLMLEMINNDIIVHISTDIILYRVLTTKKNYSQLQLLMLCVLASKLEQWG